jgi:hypothetical protein
MKYLSKHPRLGNTNWYDWQRLANSWVPCVGCHRHCAQCTPMATTVSYLFSAAHFCLSFYQMTYESYDS